MMYGSHYYGRLGTGGGNVLNMVIPAWLKVVSAIIFAFLLFLTLRRFYRFIKLNILTKTFMVKVQVMDKRYVNFDPKEETGYYVSFKIIDTGNIIDLKVPKKVYFSIFKNDISCIRYKGQRFLSFTSKV